MIELIDTFIKPDSAEWYEYASPQGLADTEIMEAAIDNFISLSLGESRVKMYNGNTVTATIVLADWDRENEWYNYVDENPGFLNSLVNLLVYNRDNGISQNESQQRLLDEHVDQG